MTMVLREKAVLFDLGYLEEERVIIYLTPSDILINICINVALKSEEKVLASFEASDGYFNKKINFRTSSCFRQVMFFCIPPLLEHGFHSVRLMNEQQSLHDSQYKLFVGAFSNCDGENTKKSVSLPDNEVQTFLEGEENQYTKRKPKVAYSVALVLAFLLAKNENRQLEDLPLADFGRLPHSLVSYRVTRSKRNFISARAHVLFSIALLQLPQ